MIFTSERERKICFFERFVSLKAEFQSGGRTRALPTFQADRFIITALAPHCPNCSNWEYSNSKERLTKMSVKKNGYKRDHFSCCSKVLSEAMGSVLILITPYDSVLSNMIPIYGSRQSCHQVVPDFSNWG